MNKLILIIVYFLSCSFVSLSQTNDTIYYGKSWSKTKKADASYYRLVKDSAGLYLVNDYYLDGTPQMKAIATSLNPEVYIGQCNYYHHNGMIDASGEYEKGSRTGIWNYFDEGGKIIKTYDYSVRANNKEPRFGDLVSSKNDKHFSIAVRGKLIGFFIIEDVYFSTATIGTELLFKGRHSLGVDYTYFGWQSERDDMKDSPLYETYERRGYWLFDYKFRFLRFKNVDLYFNLYDKIGTYHKWQEGVAEGYNEWEKPWLSNKVDGTFNQVGVGVGVKFNFSDRFNGDASINGGKMFSNNKTYTYDDSLQVFNTKYGVKTEENIFYIRVNFGYKLFIKKDKNSETFYTN